MSAQGVDTPTSSRIQPLSLVVAIVIMLAISLYPPMMATAEGKADHGLVAALLLAMSAGFVRGVGFVPRMWAWRWLFSGWTCLGALAIAGVLKMLH